MKIFILEENREAETKSCFEGTGEKETCSSRGSSEEGKQYFRPTRGFPSLQRF